MAWHRLRCMRRHTRDHGVSITWPRRVVNTRDIKSVVKEQANDTKGEHASKKHESHRLSPHMLRSVWSKRTREVSARNRVSLHSAPYTTSSNFSMDSASSTMASGTLGFSQSLSSCCLRAPTALATETLRSRIFAFDMCNFTHSKT